MCQKLSYGQGVNICFAHLPGVTSGLRIAGCQAWDLAVMGWASHTSGDIQAHLEDAEGHHFLTEKRLHSHARPIGEGHLRQLEVLLPGRLDSGTSSCPIGAREGKETTS